MIEALPAVTEPPSLKLGLRFLSFSASNWQKCIKKRKRQVFSIQENNKLPKSKEITIIIQCLGIC